AGRSPRQPFDCVAEGAPPPSTLRDSNGRVVVRLLGPGDGPLLDADHDRASPALRYPIVGRVKDASLDPEAEIALGGLFERVVLTGADQPRNVPHPERRRATLTQCPRVFAPQCTPFEPDTVTVERREALARRPTDHDIRLRKLRDLLDPFRDNVLLA